MQLFLKLFAHIRHLRRHIFARADHGLFAFCFNVESLLEGSPSRLRWQPGVETFLVSDVSLPGFGYEIRHQHQCILAYQSGVRQRAVSLAEDYFLESINFSDGDVVIDCGANVGDLKIWFDLKLLTVDYVGFEPSPVEFGCLKRNVYPSEVHQVGLWNSQGSLEFFVSSQGADSSLIEPASYERSIRVEVDRLEKYVTGPTKLLKLEAEGGEPEILEGLGSSLRQIHFIAADLGFERGIKAESTLVPVTNYLLDRGFQLVEINHKRLTALFKNKSTPA